MIDPPTVAPLGVPGMRMAPTPAEPSLVAAPPQLMLRLKKSEWRKPTQWPSSWVMTCVTVEVGNVEDCRPEPMLIVLNGRPPDGKPDEPPVPLLTTARIVALHPVVLPDVRVMCQRRPRLL